jgi:hypothetical protein
MKTRRIHLGYIGVDAGLCWIGDPCYVLPDGRDTNPGADWGKFCKVISENDKPGNPTAHNFNGIGVCVGTGYGDGEYPVTANIENGRVMSVTVNFNEDRFDHEIYDEDGVLL